MQKDRHNHANSIMSRLLQSDEQDGLGAQQSQRQVEQGLLGSTFPKFSEHTDIIKHIYILSLSHTLSLSLGTRHLSMCMSTQSDECVRERE